MYICSECYRKKPYAVSEAHTARKMKCEECGKEDYCSYYGKEYLNKQQ